MKTRYIFVHGLGGWGSYDPIDRIIPEWGMLGGSLIKYLKKQGYACYAASVSPAGSAWARACELYAQLAGTVTDYGAAHSARANHARFGCDYSKMSLIPDWKLGEPIVLIGHSFGGATVRLFSELLANGDAEERAAGGDVSPLFLGGQAARIRALVTLAAPTDGTTAYDLHDDPAFDADAVEIPAIDKRVADIMDSHNAAEPDGRADWDWAAYDMHIDNAATLNARISTLPGTYYFSVPFSMSDPQPDGTHLPVRRKMEPMMRKHSILMGAYKGKTKGGVVLDEAWRENDGLVNTISARAPFGAPQEDYVGGAARPGVWNILPTVRGDHMSVVGGMMKMRNMRPFYRDLLQMLDALPEPKSDKS